MTEQELLDQIRAGVTQEMESALTADINPVLMHAVTQSYLLLKILDKVDMLDCINGNLLDIESAIERLDRK